MSRFSQIAKGAEQIDEVELPLIGVPEPVKIGLRVLRSEHDDAILKSAREHAIAAGVPDPKDGNPIYDVALARETIALACTDVDSPDKLAPFFDNADDVRTLDRDRIAYLFERQQLWQDRCSPTKKGMDAGEYIAKVLEIAGAGAEDDGPFRSMRPALAESFMRISARLLASSPMLKSLSGTDFESFIESAAKSPDEAP